MVHKKLIVGVIWNLLWGIVAIENIQESINLNQSKNIYGNKIIVEDSNGTKFLKEISSSTKTTINAVSNCYDENLWSKNFKYEFNFIESFLTVEFIGNPKVLESINKLSIRQDPNLFYFVKSGYEFLNYKVIDFELVNNLATIPISISKSQYEKDYPIDLIFEAYGGKTKNELCNKSNILSIHINNFEKYINPSGYFADGLISDIYIKDLNNIHTITDEQEYINNYLHKINRKKLFANLPKISEATIALLSAEVSLESSEYKWIVKNKFVFEKITEEIVIGMFGEARDADVIHLERVLETLNIIAPSLKITYSSNPDKVTLPIHFANCSKEFSSKFHDCYQKLWGFYMPDKNIKHGWIWVDSGLSEIDRLPVITHEIGHAIGLNHNLCSNSVMSYSEYADHQKSFFSHIDLMMIQAIYDPATPAMKDSITDKILIEHYELNENKVEEFKNNIQNACYKQPGNYDFLINLQGGYTW